MDSVTAVGSVVGPAVGFVAAVGSGVGTALVVGSDVGSMAVVDVVSGSVTVTGSVVGSRLGAEAHALTLTLCALSLVISLKPQAFSLKP